MTQNLPEGLLDAGADCIALVGLAGRFPGARSAAELWRLLQSGQAATEWLSAEQLRGAGVSDADLADPDYVRASLVLPDMDHFDAGFFGFSQRDAAVMDPQHRQFLACAWEALEDAGHMPERFAGSVAVFAGCGMQNYLPLNLLTNPALVKSMGIFLLRHTGNDKDLLTSRLSYLLDLRGPSITVQTACSTSLVAVHLAAQSLLSGECDMALAGGVSIELPHGRGYHYAPGEILSPDGLCRAFDAQAAGTLFGSGVGVVVLRRLADALADGDQIYAVIRGSAVNNDGAQKAGYLAPSVEGQARAAVEALAVAGVAPDSVQYIEAHGTGTPVGDPIEVAALAQAYGVPRAAGRCGIGSLKTNIGHLDTAAGVAGLIKVALAFRHGVIPASLHFSQPNPRLGLERTPFEVLGQARPWPRGTAPRRAAVNALGVGGTNAHVVLEEAPATAERLPRQQDELDQLGWHLLTLSARTPGALQRLQAKWLDFLKAPGAQFNLADAAHTLRVGRRDFPHRLAVVAREPAGLAELLAASAARTGAAPRRWQAEAGAEPPAVVMMFPGGGAPYPGAGRALLGLPAFADAVQACFSSLEKLGPAVPPDLYRVMFGNGSSGSDTGDNTSNAAALLQKPRYGLPALFVLSYALARLWQSWGVKPAALIGHSAGDYAAACIAGVMSLEDALAIVVLRAQLFEQSPPGGMLGVDVPEAELQAHIDAASLALDVAVVNAADHCIASGALAPLAALESRLAEAGVQARRLRIDVAAHSRLLDGVLLEFANRMACARLSAPQIPMVSNLTGTWASTAQLTDPAYWVQHLRQPVRFAAGLDTVLALPHAALLEVGPGQGLLALAQQAQLAQLAQLAPAGQPRQTHRAVLLPSTAKATSADDDLAVMLGSAGALWARGAALDWTAVMGSTSATHSLGLRRISLPTYAFEPERHWIEPGLTALPSAASVPTPALERLPQLADWMLTPQWRPAPLHAQAVSSSAPSAVAGQHWLVFGGPAPLTADLVLSLLNDGARVTLVRPGLEFASLIDGSYTIDPAEPLHYRQLLQAVATQSWPAHILHVWAMDAGLQASPEMAELTHAMRQPGQSLPGQILSFDSLLYLAQALQAEDLNSPLRLTVLTAGSQSVRGERTADPAQALALGPCRVIPQELPWVQTRLVDLPSPDLHGLNAGVDESLPRRVLAECLANDAADLVALRGSERLLMQCVPAGPASTAASASLPPGSRLRQGGVYLITGGLGALGLALAEYLARTQQARLALMSRRSLPPPETWRQAVDAASAEALADSASQPWLLKRLLGLQEAGAQVLLLSADVTDAPAMGRALAHCRGRFGALHGVFHAAGELDDGPIHAKTPASVQRVLAAKALGAQVLHTLLPPGTLDVFTVFSSTSVYLGAPGQIDYVAANAYLDALAASRPDGLCLHWGIWGDAGMARRAYAPALAKLHPLLGRRVDASRFLAQLAPASEWLLREHQIAGRPVLVGMAYVEMARAALQSLHPGAGLELRALSFGEAMVFAGDAPREVLTTLQAEAVAGKAGASPLVYAFEVQSRTGPAAPWQAHARATVHVLDAAAVKAAQLAEAAKAHSVAKAEAKAEAVAGAAWQAGRTPQGRWLAFGKRWQCVRRMRLQPAATPGSGRAELALPADCAADLATYACHPALADMATTFALQLPQVPDTALYVPLSVARIRLFAPLGAELRSHVVLKHQDRDRLIGFDVQVQAPSGEFLASFESFYLRGVPPESVGRGSGSSSAVSADAQRPARPPSLIERMLAGGIRQADAPVLFDRIFAGSERELVISSFALPALRAALAPAQAKVAAHPAPAPSQRLPGADSAASAASAASAYSSAEPMPAQAVALDPVHEGVAAAWRELLGVGELSRDDDFFALGGHSLAAVRLFARIRKVFGVDLPLATLFETPTLGALVDRVRADYAPPKPPTARASLALPAELTLTPLATAPSASSAPGAWSPLVRINAGRPGVKPLFCIHGAAGNVLNFKVIADRLGASQPFYGLQAQGVDGRLPPQPSIEAMASRYIAAIKEVDPLGPYRLAGYSGGGVIAYEMAQQLRRAGAQVAMLVMFDTLAPAAAGAHLSPLRKLWLMRHWSLGFTLAWPARRRVRRTEQINHVLALQALARGEPLTPELASARLYSHFVAAQAQYRPEPYAGHLLLLRAEQGYTPYLNAGPQLGWQHHVQGRIEVVEIPGSHVSMLTEPGLTQLARALREQLARCQDTEDGLERPNGPPNPDPDPGTPPQPGTFMPGVFGNAMQRDLM